MGKALSDVVISSALAVAFARTSDGSASDLVMIGALAALALYRVLVLVGEAVEGGEK